MCLQVDSDHYYKNYDTKGRFCSYWYQIHEVVSLNPRSILEIGVGNRFFSDYVKKVGFDVSTLDIDKRLKPDFAGSIWNIPFCNRSFDVVACYEVLEHLPYNQFVTALKELNRVSRKYVVLSIPDAGPTYRIYMHFPKVREFKQVLPLPWKSREHSFDGQHYWEIGKRSYPLKRISSDIEKAGFTIKKTYRTFENPYHRFFVLNKI